jgi:hypothetical protein
MAAREAARILASQELLDALAVVERSISQNVYHSKHLLYRNVPDFTAAAAAVMEEEVLANIAESGGDDGGGGGVDGGAAGVDGGAGGEETADAAKASAGGVGGALGGGIDSPTKSPSLEHLWTFVCPLTRGRNVSSISFNPHNQDLVAITYGEFDFNKQRDGLLCFWSLKNPAYPQRFMRADCGITAAAWSPTHHNLIATGHYDGTVAVFDTRNEEDKPVLESGQTTSKHTDAVWQVQWINKPGRDGELIVSISTDGRVTAWDVKKGITSTPLMVLKRIPNQFGLDGRKETDKAEGILSRQASGLCFDFGSKDHSTYLAATEDGIVHKCSVSYGEQYLQSYFGHSGPVYALCCSPFDDQVFLTCSADWTVKLWSENQGKMTGSSTGWAMQFQTSDLTSDVYHVAWSPADATVFGSVTGDGRIQLWDLANPNPMDPVVNHVVQPTREEVDAMQRADDTKRQKAEDEAREAAAAGLGMGLGTLSGLHSSAKKEALLASAEKPDAYATAVAAAAHVAQMSLGTHVGSGTGSGEGGAGNGTTQSGTQAAPGSPGGTGGSHGGEGPDVPELIEVEGVLIPRGRKKLSCIRFASNAPVILVGDNTGGIGVYRMHGMQVRGRELRGGAGGGGGGGNVVVCVVEGDNSVEHSSLHRGRCCVSLCVLVRVCVVY